MRLLFVVENQFAHINPAAVSGEDERIADFNRFRRTHMRMSGDQNIQPFHLTCRLNIFIQRATHICASHTGLAGRNTFVDQGDGQINLAFEFIDITL